MLAHVFAPKDWFTQAIVAHFPNIIIGIVETTWNFSYADDVNVNILASVQKMTLTLFVRLLEASRGTATFLKITYFRYIRRNAFVHER